MAATIHPDDLLHVTLDAIAFTMSEIENNPNYRPWEDYDGKPDEDSKVTRDGYKACLQQAADTLTQRLNASQPL